MCTVVSVKMLRVGVSHCFSVLRVGIYHCFSENTEGWCVLLFQLRH